MTLQNNLGNLGTRQNNQNAGILSRQPSRNGSRAFWSVIENIFARGEYVNSQTKRKHSYKDIDTRDLTPEQQALLAGLMAQGRTDAKLIRTKNEQLAAKDERLAEKLAKKDERLAEKLADTKAYYREARARGVESRAKTELRGKIKRKVGELNTFLTFLTIGTVNKTMPFIIN